MLSRTRVTKLEINMDTLTLLIKGVTDEGQSFVINTDAHELVEGVSLEAFKRFTWLLNKFAENRTFGRKSDEGKLYKGA